MQYNRTSFFGIVFAIMSVANTVMEFGFGKGIRVCRLFALAQHCCCLP